MGASIPMCEKVSRDALQPVPTGSYNDEEGRGRAEARPY